MKKILTLSLAALMVLCLAACGSTGTAEPADNQDAQEATETVDSSASNEQETGASETENSLIASDGSLLLTGEQENEAIQQMNGSYMNIQNINYFCTIDGTSVSILGQGAKMMWSGEISGVLVRPDGSYYIVSKSDGTGYIPGNEFLILYSVKDDGTEVIGFTDTVNNQTVALGKS